MDLTYAAILVLAAAVFVLSGMVGYIYWRHTRLQQSVQSLSIVVSSLVTPAELEEPPADLANIPEVADEPEEEVADDVDDRVSVEHVTEPPAASTEPPASPEIDIDDLQSKTAVQLRELLSQKGIPFGKRDSKSTLIELLKATA
jgi:hypothetical protein